MSCYQPRPPPGPASTKTRPPPGPTPALPLPQRIPFHPRGTQIIINLPTQYNGSWPCTAPTSGTGASSDTSTGWYSSPACTDHTDTQGSFPTQPLSQQQPRGTPKYKLWDNCFYLCVNNVGQLCPGILSSPSPKFKVQSQNPKDLGSH